MCWKPMHQPVFLGGHPPPTNIQTLLGPPRTIAQCILRLSSGVLQVEKCDGHRQSGVPEDVILL